MSLLRVSNLIALGTTSVLCAALLLLGSLASAAQTSRPGGQTKLSRTEAEILVYLMPIAKQLRTHGFDVGWEIREDEDSFHFSVYNSKRKCKEGCSVTVGNYTVNALTAVVTDDDLNKVVTNQEMRGIGAILRRAHHIPQNGLGEN